MTEHFGTTALAQHRLAFGNEHVRVILTLYPSIATTGEIFWNGEVTFNGVLLVHVANASSKVDAFERLKEATGALSGALAPLLATVLSPVLVEL